MRSVGRQAEENGEGLGKAVLPAKAQAGATQCESGNLCHRGCCLNSNLNDLDLVVSFFQAWDWPQRLLGGLTGTQS